MHPHRLWRLGHTAALLLLTLALIHTRRRLLAAYHDRAYGVLTRAGGEAAWQRLRHPVEIIFLDLDHVHLLNTRLGYAEVDRRIRAAIQLRRSDLLLMRWFSGDELVAIVPAETGVAIAQRLSASLQAHGLSGTFGIVRAQSRQLAYEVSRAMRLVAAAKAADQRGRILTP